MNLRLPIIKSPVQMDVNATLYFERETGEYAIDPVTMNETAVYTSFIVKAHITEVNNKSGEEDSPGLDQVKKRVIGFLLVKSLPKGLRSSDRVKIVMSTSGIQEEGILFFAEQVTSMRTHIVQTIGIPIEGYFQTVGGGS